MGRLRSAAVAAAVLIVVVPLASAAPPAPTISGGPTGFTSQASPTFTFSAAGATTYSCDIDVATPATSCGGTYAPSPALADGPHTFYVTASDGVDQSPVASSAFNVDTAAPVLTLPANQSVDAPSYAGPVAVAYTATSSDGSGSGVASFSCVPASGSAFTLGTTTVTCNTTDNVGNAATAGSFTVTVTDTTPPAAPTVSGGPTGTTVDSTPTFTFGAVAGASGYKCAIDNATPTTACNSLAFTPAAALGDGPHTFYVSASDLAGNESSPATRAFTVDTTPPGTSITTSIPATITTTSLSVAFTATDVDATFACKLDAAAFASCSSPVHLTGLGDGAHTFAVRATDAVGNTDATPASASWTVDATPPLLAGPGNLTVEADGPSGTRVSYSVSASDGSPPTPLLPGAVSCSPQSSSQFALGQSTVTCTATDAAGNVGTSTFNVTVVDTTPPTINAPAASFTATSAAGIPRSNPAVASYLAKISATDLVSAVTVTTTTPETLPIGETNIVVTARDAAGNTAQKAVTLTVLAEGKVAPPTDFTPPGAVERATARSADHAVLLGWKLPSAKDLAFVRIDRSVVGKSKTVTVYRGSGTSFRSGGLANGVGYRFTLVAVDKAGNSSRSIVVSATPMAVLLETPKRGTAVVRPPLLRWAPVRSARYFNVQLYRGGTKILSAWPTLAHFQLSSHWSYGRHTQTLKPGVYTWYVWPGLGARAAARYGDLLGKSSFAVVAPKKT